MSPPFASQAPLNAVVEGGSIEWKGNKAAGWQPASVCVDWMSSNFAVLCNVNSSIKDLTWQLEDCQPQIPNIRCSQLD